MVRGVGIHALLAFVTHNNAQEMATHLAIDELRSDDLLVDNLMDDMFYQPSDADLDKMTIGAPSHLALSRSNGVAASWGLRGQAAAREQLIAPPVAPPRGVVNAPRKRAGTVVGFASAAPPASSQRAGVLAHAVKTGDEFEVDQEKPIGISWKKGADGGIYVSKVVPGTADPRVQIGDKLVEVSASFGPEVWQANSYAQSMMAVQTRIGKIYMKILARGGNTDVLEEKTGDDQFSAERASGNYGAGTEEEMRKRYAKGKGLDKLRMKIHKEGVEAFKAGDYEKALSAYQEVRELEPPNYIADNGARITQIYKYASYNIACCYSMLRNEKEALKELEVALNAGWVDYDKVRTDEYLAFVRESNPAKFKAVLERYDEPLFNADALKVFGGMKSLFR